MDPSAGSGPAPRASRSSSFQHVVEEPWPSGVPAGFWRSAFSCRAAEPRLDAAPGAARRGGVFVRHSLQGPGTMRKPCAKAIEGHTAAHSARYSEPLEAADPGRCQLALAINPSDRRAPAPGRSRQGAVRQRRVLPPSSLLTDERNIIGCMPHSDAPEHLPKHPLAGCVTWCSGTSRS